VRTRGLHPQPGQDQRPSGMTDPSEGDRPATTLPVRPARDDHTYFFRSK
jgi:hypothetical protein